MAAAQTLPHSSALRKSGVLVLSGYGIRVQVSAGHLTLHDGVADVRRTIRLPRVNHGLKRLVMIGNDGFITLTWQQFANSANFMGYFVAKK